MRILIYIVIALLALILLYSIRLVYLAKTSAAPAGFGDGSSELSCPIDRPNCVSSKNSEPNFQSTAFRYAGTQEAALSTLKVAISSEPRVEFRFESPTRIEATFRTALFGFPDDAAFEINEGNSTIELRSKSRVGYSDMGVNAKRIERIRLAFIDSSAAVKN